MTKANKKTRDIELLKDASMFIISIHCAFGNRKTIPKASVTCDASEQRTNATVKLIVSKEFKAIERRMADEKDWCLMHCMPSYIHRGINIIKLSEAEKVAAHIKECNRAIRDELLPAFLNVYRDQIEEARKPKSEGGLGSLFDERDYPTEDKLRGCFGVEHQFVSFGIPEGLSDQMRQEAAAKIQRQFAEAEHQITAALRAGFNELVQHAFNRLQPTADGKTPIFRDTLLTNFNEFFDTFGARNLANDTELEDAMNKVKQLLDGVKPDELRDNTSTREQVANKFKEVATVMDSLVEDAPLRKFDFSE